MSKVYEIREPISKEMEVFEEKFSKLMLSQLSMVDFRLSDIEIGGGLTFYG